MFTLNTTIDDVDPLIVYDPPDVWFQGNVSTDPKSNYWQGTKTWTQTLDASARFRFNGTAIVILGAKRHNHGLYSVTIDDMPARSFNGYANPPIYQSIIFNASNLPQGIHNVTVINTGGMFLDIDYIRWTSSVGETSSNSSQPTVVVVQDTNPTFKYTPANAWSTSPALFPTYNSSSRHTTVVPGAAVNFTFQGDAVSLYGAVGPQNSAYSVHLDNVDVGTFNSQKDAFTPEVLLYQADNLGLGNHTLSLVKDNSSLTLELDYAVVSIDKDSGTLTLPPADSNSSSQSTAVSTGVAVAIAVAVELIFFLIFLVWYLNRRNKTLWTRLRKGYMVQSQSDSPMISTEPLPASTLTQQVSTASKSSSGQGSTYNRGPLAVVVPPLPAPNRTDTMNTESTLNTTSTLVAENGSVLDESMTRRFTLQLVSKLTQMSESPVTARSPSMRRLLSEETEEESEEPVGEEELGYISHPGMMYARTVGHPKGPRYR